MTEPATTPIDQSSSPPAPAAPAAAPVATLQQPTPPQDSAPKIRVGGDEFAESDVRAALAAKAEGDVRRATLPQKPDDYEAKLPGDFKLPEGMTFELNAQDPRISHARDFALKYGLPKEAFSESLPFTRPAKCRMRPRLQQLEPQRLQS